MILIALLRGINVGGKTTLPMADLRRIVEGCGYGDVRTYIQSGNVVFAAPDGTDPDDVATDLAAAIAAAKSPLEPEVVVRTAAQMRKVVDGNPYLRRGEDPGHLHVVFTAGRKASVGLDGLAGYAPEEAVAKGSEIYFFLPGGVGRSPLAADFAKQAGRTGTMRNWRTVTKLVAMAAEEPA
jgi:uncharacterized protein (DUF1697 family)